MSATTKHKLEFTHAIRPGDVIAPVCWRIPKANRDVKKDRIQQKVTELVISIQGDNHTSEYKRYAPESLIEGIWMKDLTKCTPIFSGDPRGCVLKIRVPDGFSDDGNGEGICVPS